MENNTNLFFLTMVPSTGNIKLLLAMGICACDGNTQVSLLN